MEPDDDKTQSHFSLTAGTSVSHYKIVSKIGSGGMGEVWLAEDTKLNRRVALKFMPAHAAADASLKARFTREAQAAAKLDHPNIVPVHEVGEFQGRPFFAMAHIEGQSLREVIKQGKLSVSEAIELTMQICEGLNEAHNEGVVHRDIKPGNIIIDTKRRPRLVDFGLATVAGDEKLTKTGSTLGTVGYMSPEQVEGKQVDHRTDLFSVGVILYEMLTGRRPFEGDNDAAVARAITDTNPEPVARFKSGVTGELQQVIDKALTKDPSLRYQHADGMLADLKRLTTEPASVKRSRLRWWVAAAVVVCCVAGYFVVDRVITSSGEIEGWSNSVAVLVFRDLSTNQDQDAFCEGMTEEIIGRLQSIRQLKVISTQSMLRFKGSDVDLKAIGKELAVDNILAGSVQKEGDSIRVRAELISVEDDVSIWSDRYYREFNSAWAVQEDISRAIAEVLEMELTGEETTALVSRGTDDIEAYNAYLQGRFFWRKRAEIHLRRSIEFFERAIELDPDYALAYSGLCDAWRQLRGYGISSPAEEQEAIAKADAAAERAFELNENLAEVQASMAGVYTRRYYGPDGTADDLARAEQGYQRAIEINPGYVWAHLWYSSLLREAGRDEEWKRELMTAYELDPLAAVVLANLAYYHRHFGDNAKAKEIYTRIIDLEPSFPNVYGDLAWVYSGEGQVDSALMMAEKYAEASPELFYRPYLLKAELLRRSGKFEEAEAMYLRSIELAPERSRPYARYGDFLNGMQRWGEAVQYFEKAIDLGSNEAWVHRDYGYLLGMLLGRHKEGLEQLFRAVELNPRDVSAYNSMAYTYDIVGNVDSAIWAADMAVEVAPNDTWRGNSLDTRADMYSRDGRFDSAISSYQQALEVIPNSAETVTKMGDIYSFMKDYERADSVYGSLNTHSDTISRSMGRYCRVKVLTHQGKFRAALELLEEGIELDRSEKVRVHWLLLKVYLQGIIWNYYLNDHERAIEKFAEAEVVNQEWIKSPYWTTALTGAQAEAMARMGRFDDAHAVLETCRSNIDATDTRRMLAYQGYLGRILRQEGNYDSAVVLAEAEAEKIDWSNQFRIYRTLGLSYFEAGRFEDAARTLETAMARYDNNRFGFPDRSVTAHYWLGQAYEGAGRTADAIEQYETFLDIWKNADDGLESVEDARARLARLKGEA